MSQQITHKKSFMETLATFIVDKRNLFFPAYHHCPGVFRIFP